MTPIITFTITPRELEQLTGQEIADRTIGGIIGGIYRPAAQKSLRGQFTCATIELLVAALVFVLSLPLGLPLLRQSNVGGIRVFWIAFGVTIGVMLGRQIYRQWQLKRLRRLLPLLDAVDQFNAVIQTLGIVASFGSGPHPAQSIADQQVIATALELTRENLVAALVTERLLRENQSLLDRQTVFLSHFASNLTILETLEVNQQAQEYQQVIHEALMINATVQHEMTQL
jgi:hypothetical protein